MDGSGIACVWSHEAMVQCSAAPWPFIIGQAFVRQQACFAFAE